MNQPPIIDLKSSHAAEALAKACSENGFFYISNHGISIQLQKQLEQLSRDFFTLPMATKMKIHMSKGGSAWRGFFPVGEELTSGQPDQKEGIYFGEELAANHPDVSKGKLLHGANLFLSDIPQFKAVVLDYMQAMTSLAHQIMELISESLQLPKDYMLHNYTTNPITLFRIFHYPPTSNPSQWGVGEHTDYGVLTILKQDDNGGLQIKSNDQWIAAPPIPNTFVCNIGDMLERITGGLYKSTPHRVLNTSGKSRLSFPFFFDPNFDAKVETISTLKDYSKNSVERWDRKSVFDFEGTYGDYILGKVSKVFPELRNKNLD